MGGGGTWAVTRAPLLVRGHLVIALLLDALQVMLRLCCGGLELGVALCQPLPEVLAPGLMKRDCLLQLTLL